MPRRSKKKSRKHWDPREEVQSFAQEFAEKAAVRPQDFAYWGDLPIGDTWGYVLSRSRDADLLEESNYETVKADLEERFPDDVREERSSHWAVGWVDQLAVRLLDDQGIATRAADAVYEWRRALENYPVADDEDLSRREYEDTIENIKSEGGIDEDVAGEVFSWLWDNDQSAVEPRDGRGGYPSEEQIQKALWAIGKPTEEMVAEKEEAEQEEWEAMTPEEREAKRRREYVDPPEQQRLFGSLGADLSGRKDWDPRARRRSYVWSTYARYGNRPAGWIGTYATKAEAVAAGERQRMSYVVKRERSKSTMSGRKSWDPRQPKQKDLRAPYDPDLPSMPPFMWVERHDRVGPLGVIAFGAYNAMGLIGSEKGGVAVVHEDPPAVIATRDMPWEPLSRDAEATAIVKLLKDYGPYDEISVEARQELLGALKDRRYEVRWEA